MRAYPTSTCSTPFSAQVWSYSSLRFCACKFQMEFSHIRKKKFSVLFLNFVARKLLSKKKLFSKKASHRQVRPPCSSYCAHRHNSNRFYFAHSSADLQREISVSLLFINFLHSSLLGLLLNGSGAHSGPLRHRVLSTE